MWSDNTFYIPNFSCTGIVCKTNTPSNTSMRGPGVIKSIWNIEMLMERIAFELSMSPDAVRQANFYTEGQLTPYLEPVTNITLPACWNALVAQSNYVQTKADVATFNAANRWRKRGVHISTVKYGQETLRLAHAPSAVSYFAPLTHLFSLCCFLLRHHGHRLVQSRQPAARRVHGRRFPSAIHQWRRDGQWH